MREYLLIVFFDFSTENTHSNKYFFFDSCTYRDADPAPRWAAEPADPPFGLAANMLQRVQRCKGCKGAKIGKPTNTRTIINKVRDGKQKKCCK